MDQKQIDYDALYQRAKGKIPDATGTGERFKLPLPELFVEGKTTILRNFKNIVDTIRRDEKHFTAYLLKELGTAGHVEEGRLIFKSRVTQEAISGRINDYLATFVLCTECGRPDTHITKEERTSIIVCEACGASRPITGGKAKAKAEEENKTALKEGTILDVTVTEMGKRGDGVAHVGDYTVFVTNARVKIGEAVKVKVIKISRFTAFSILAG